MEGFLIFGLAEEVPGRQPEDALAGLHEQLDEHGDEDDERDDSDTTDDEREGPVLRVDDAVDGGDDADDDGDAEGAAGEGEDDEAGSSGLGDVEHFFSCESWWESLAPSLDYSLRTQVTECKPEIKLF
jgi:hypothetical protein